MTSPLEIYDTEVPKASVSSQGLSPLEAYDKGLDPIVPKKPSAWETAKDIGYSAFDIGSMIGGMPMAFMGSGLASVAGPLFSPKGTPPQVTREATEDLQELISGALVQPLTPAGEKFAQWAGVAFKPIEVIGHFTDEQVSKIDPRLGLISGFVAELATMGLAGGLGVKGYKRLRGLREKVDAGDISGARKDINSVLSEDFGIDPGDARLKTPEGRQAIINEKFGQNLKTPEGRQGKIDEFWSEEGTPTMTPQEIQGLISGEPLPLIRRGVEETVRTNKEAQEHQARQQTLTKQLKPVEPEVPESASRIRAQAEEASRKASEVKEAKTPEGRDVGTSEGQVRVRDAAQDRVEALRTDIGLIEKRLEELQSSKEPGALQEITELGEQGRILKAELDTLAPRERTEKLPRKIQTALRKLGYDKEDLIELRKDQDTAYRLYRQGLKKEEVPVETPVEPKTASEAFKILQETPEYIESERLWNEYRALENQRKALEENPELEAKITTARKVYEEARAKTFTLSESKKWSELEKVESKTRKSKELTDQKELDDRKISKWDKETIQEVESPVHGTDIKELEGILSDGLNAGSAIDLTPDKGWATGYPVQVVVPSARRGRKIEHNDFYNSANPSRVAKVFIDMEQYTSEASPNILKKIEELKAKYPEVKFVVKEEPPTSVNKIDKAVESAVTKTEEPPVVEAKPKTIPEFKKEDFKLEDGVLTNNEYDLWGKKEFETKRAAEKHLNSSQAKAFNEELKASGVELEVIKVGDKYRLAEPMRATADEAALLSNQIERYLKDSGKLTEETSFEPKKVETELRRYQDDINNWVQGKGELDTGNLRDRLTDIGEKLRFDPETRGLSEVASAMLEALNKNKAKVEAVKAGADPEVMVGQHPSRRIHEDGSLAVYRKGKETKGTKPLQIVYDKNGEPFKSPLDAVRWMQEKKLKGVVDEHPELEGFVIELREPKKFEWTAEREAAAQEAARRVKEGLEPELTPEEAMKEAKVSEWRSILDEIIKPLLDERGSFSMEKLPPEKIEALRRIAKEAAKYGKTVGEYVKGLGIYSESQAKQVESLVERISKTINMSRPSVGTEKLQTGEPVNVGELEKQRGNYTLRRTPIYEGEFQAAKATGDLPRYTIGPISPFETSKVEKFKRSFKRVGEFVGKLSEEYLETTRRIEELKSPLYNQLHDTSLDARFNAVTEANARKQYVKNLHKGLSRGKSGERILTYALWQQKSLRPRLEKAGFTEGSIPKLTPRELEAYRGMRELYDIMGEEYNTIMPENGRRPLKLEENYFTFAYAEALAKKLGFDPNLTVDPSHVVRARHAEVLEVPFKYKSTRSKSGVQSLIKQNAFDVINDYIEYHSTVKHFTPLVSKLNELMSPLKDGVDPKTGEVKTWEMKKEKPNTFEWLNRWRNQLAGTDPDAPLTLKRNAKNRAIEKGFRTVSGNIANAILSFSVRTGPVQLASLVQTSGVVGIPRTILGLSEMFHFGKVKEAWRESKILRISTSDIDLKNIRNIHPKDLGYAHITLLDAYSRTATYLAAKSYAKGVLKLTDANEIRRFADVVTAKTQATGIPSEIAPVQRSALGKAFHTLQTFAIADWNTTYKDIFGFGRGEKLSNKQRAWRVMNFLIASSLASSFFEDVMNTNSPLPTPIRAAKKAYEDGKDPAGVGWAVLKELSEKLPGIGGSVRYGTDLFGVVPDTVGKLFKSGSDWLDEDPYDGVGPTWEYLLKLRGVPGTHQLAKSTRAWKRGNRDPYDVLMGTYLEQGKSSNFGFGFSNDFSFDTGF